MQQGIPNLSRRTFLCGCASSIFLGGCGGGADGGGDISPANAAAGARGCMSISAFASQATQAPGCGLPMLSSGSALWDAEFRGEFNLQTNFWGIPGVSFAFLNDCNSPNAFANPRDRSILFGTSMANKLLTSFGSTIPLWQVMAHEWGHQIQYALGDNWLNAPTVAPKELEADMFSGFYLLMAKNSQNLSTSITNAFSIGDWGFNDPNHHGTPPQRAAAVLAGGKVALEVNSGTTPRTYPAIRQRFAQELSLIL